MKPIPYIIEEVVDKMRYKGNYTAVKNGTVYTLLSFRHPLNDNEWVKIDDKDYRIFDSLQDSFKITSSNIPLTGEWKALAPYYMYGHRMEIADRLMQKENSKVYRYQKYPLIALRMDLAEKINKHFIEAKINVAILEFTKENQTADQRYSNVILPKLYPLYNRFLTALKKYGKLNTLGTPEHTKLDRPFWGIEFQEGNVKKIFEDPLDAIELIDLKIKVINS